MEIKIQCTCGSRYKFDLEPVNGRSPSALACPNCQASWTDEANAIIAQSLAQPAAPSVAAVSVAPPVAAPALAMSPPAPGTAPKIGLRVSGLAPREASPAAETAAAGEVPASVPMPSGRPMPRVVGLDPVLEPQHSMGSFGMGALGALLGALLGSGLYYLLFIHTDVRLKLLALGVGFLAGMGARVLSKDRSKELGAIVAVLAIATIVGSQYLIAQHWFKEEDATAASPKSDYEDRVAEARQVVAAVPNGTDQEIRVYLAKLMADDGEKPDPKAVERADIQEFKDADLPRYRDLANGRISKEDYDKANTVTLTAEERQKEKEETERTFKWIFLALTLSKFNIACMIGAAGIGYKMTADA